MAQEHLDSRVGQHSRLWRPGHQQQVLGQGRGALQVDMLSLGGTGVVSGGGGGGGGGGGTGVRQLQIQIQVTELCAVLVGEGHH
jgi:hypothetical protein